MGSTASILLSFARGINLSLFLALTVSYLTGIESSMLVLSLVFVSFFFIPWGKMFPEDLDITNYYSTPLNPHLEVILPFILGFLLYRGTNQIQQMMLLGLGLLYFLGVRWLLISNGDFDLQARKNTFGF